MINFESFRRYTNESTSAWNLVERDFFRRFLKEQYTRTGLFNWLNSQENRGIPAITTSNGSLIPRDFRALDLGTGTGNVAASLLEFGVLPENIVGVDINDELLNTEDYPEGVIRLVGDIANLSEILAKGAPKFGNFDLVTANMVFHLFNYRNYVETLRQIRKVVTEPANLCLIVPHPIRDKIRSIAQYHNRSLISEEAPWHEMIVYPKKTITDYRRGMVEAGFRDPEVRTTGVNLGDEDRILISESAVWEFLRRRKRKGPEVDLPHYFRMRLVTQPRIYDI